jgi:hypothetical protein
MREADYTEALPEAVSMAFAPLRAFSQVLEAITDKGAKVHPYDVGVVASAIVDYSERRLAEALDVVEANVGHISVAFAGEACSIADRVVDAELTPVSKKKARASAVVLLAPAKDEEDAHHG